MAAIDLFDYDQALSVKLPDGRIVEIYTDGRVEVFTTEHSTFFQFDLPARGEWDEIMPGRHALKLTSAAISTLD